SRRVFCSFSLNPPEKQYSLDSAVTRHGAPASPGACARGRQDNPVDASDSAPCRFTRCVGVDLLSVPRGCLGLNVPLPLKPPALASTAILPRPPFRPGVNLPSSGRRQMSRLSLKTSPPGQGPFPCAGRGTVRIPSMNREATTHMSICWLRAVQGRSVG